MDHLELPPVSAGQLPSSGRRLPSGRGTGPLIAPSAPVTRANTGPLTEA